MSDQENPFVKPQEAKSSSSASFAWAAAGLALVVALLFLLLWTRAKTGQQQELDSLQSDAREPDTFLRVLSKAHKSFEYAWCDWTLAGEELVAAYRMTQDSPITILCPE